MPKKTIPENSISFLLNVPNDVLIGIFSFLDINSLLNMGAVCKKLKKISETPHLWFFHANPRKDFILRSTTVAQAEKILNIPPDRFININFLYYPGNPLLFQKLISSHYYAPGAYVILNKIYVEDDHLANKFILQMKLIYDVRADKGSDIAIVYVNSKAEIKDYKKRYHMHEFPLFVTDKENWSTLKKYSPNIIAYDHNQPLTVFFNSIMQKCHEIANHVPKNPMSVVAKRN